MTTDDLAHSELSLRGQNKRRTFGLLALILVSLLLAWQVYSAALADRLASDHPIAALRWQKGHGEALTRQAEILIASNDKNSVLQARELIQRALAADPLYIRAIRTAGLIEESFGSIEKAKSLMEIAAARSLYEVPAHLWLVSYYARQEEFEPLLNHLSALLTAASQVPNDIRTRLMEALTVLATSPGISEAIVAELELEPIWRAVFLRKFSQETPDVNGLLRFYAQLQESNAPPNDMELSLFLTRLIDEEYFEAAYLAWIDSLVASEQLEVSNIYNGNFEQAPTLSPFDWSLGRFNGAEISITPRAIDDNALRVSFDGARGRFRHISELLLLGPGEYELSGEIRAEASFSPAILEWVIECANGEVIGRAGPFSRTLGWSAFAAKFVILRGCPWQSLRLQYASDTDVGGIGEIWFDNIQAIRLGPAP